MTVKNNVSVSLTPTLRLEQALKEAGVVDAASVVKLAISGEVAEADFWYIHENMANTLKELDTSETSKEGNRLNVYKCGCKEDMAAIDFQKPDKSILWFWNGQFLLTFEQAPSISKNDSSSISQTIRANKQENDMTYDEFIESWKRERPKYKTFCYDGILNDEIWDKSSSKIMFLLKETYSDFNEIRGDEYGGCGTSKTFWRRMRMWTYIIEETLNGKKPSFKKTMSVKEDPNNSIAYVNLKKYAQKKEFNNMAYSDDNDILKYVERDKEFLLKQIDYIKPRIILCAGTFKFCDKLFDNIESISDRLYKVNDIFLIDFGHLSQRGSYRDNYDELIKIVTKITVKK